jgi:NAD/NADP transhydrogenase beta subunit
VPRSASGLARKVEMTGMPELIAMLHSFVGLAAVLVGWNSSYETGPTRPSTTPRSSSASSSVR